MTSFPLDAAGGSAVSAVVSVDRSPRTLRLLALLGLDLAAVLLALLAATLVHRAVGLTVSVGQSGVVPVVVVTLWLGAVLGLGGYHPQTSGRFELLVVVVASELTAATTWIGWHVSGFAVSYAAWATLMVCGTLLLLAGRRTAGRALHRTEGIGAPPPASHRAS